MWLCAVLGPKLVKEYQRKFGGQKIWIPKKGTALPCRYCPHRERHLRLLRRRGWSAQRLARRFDLTVKRVYELLQGAPQFRPRRFPSRA